MGVARVEGDGALKMLLRFRSIPLVVHKGRGQRAMCFGASLSSNSNAFVAISLALGEASFCGRKPKPPKVLYVSASPA
jgi:hypothetical protein